MGKWDSSLEFSPANVNGILVNMQNLWYTKRYYIIILTPRGENLQELKTILHNRTQSLTFWYWQMHRNVISSTHG